MDRKVPTRLMLALSLLAFCLVLVSSEFASVSGTDDFKVTITLSNPSESPIRILQWQNVLSPTFPSRLIHVVNDDDGTPLRYRGAMAKVGPPHDDHSFLTLAPSSTLDYVLDLSQHFIFLSDKDYRVTIGDDLWTCPSDSSVFDTPSHAHIAPLQRHCEKHVFQYEYKFTASSDSPLPWSSETTFRRYSADGECTSSQRTSISSAVSKAWSAALSDATYLSSYCYQTWTGFERWFGSKSTSTWSKVRSTYSNIKSNMNSLNFMCGGDRCQSSTFAYVYPGHSEGWNVYLCGQFWEASSSLGYNSKPGTIIHEMTHFEDVGDTDDQEYGYESCRDLARSSGYKAARNADNYEYFTEFSKEVCGK